MAAREENVMRRLLILLPMLMATAAAAAVLAQTPVPARSPSPDGIASTHVGAWKPDDRPGARVATGKWIDVLYGRPLKRGRADLWGSGATYGAALKGGAPVWRAGANVLTRLRTEVPLTFATRTLPAGEYTMFVDLKGPAEWTLIVSSQPAQATDDVPTRIRQWEAFVYAPDKDVLRAPMRVESLPYSMEQLTYVFTDVTGTSGTLRLMWDTVMASVAFTVGL
jgi:hypothetical protein